MAGLQGIQSGTPQNCRTGIGWQEVIAVLFGILGGAVYCVRAKQPTNKKAIVFALACLLNLIGALTSSEQPTVTSQPVVQSSPTSQQTSNVEQEAQAVLAEIRQKYNFSRFIDTWGMGTQGLFLPEDAWSKLYPSQKQILIDYAQSKNFKAIVVGRLIGPNNIALDRTVWGS